MARKSRKRNRNENRSKTQPNVQPPAVVEAAKVDAGVVAEVKSDQADVAERKVIEDPVAEVEVAGVELAEAPVAETNVREPITVASSDYTHEALAQLLSEVSELKASLHEIVDCNSHRNTDTVQDLVEVATDRDIAELQAQLDEANARLWELQRTCDELTEQNTDLAARVAGHQVDRSIRSTNATDVADDGLLSWDERKQLIYRQLEDDDFDAETFLSTLPRSVTESSLVDRATGDPVQIVTTLFDQLTQLQFDVERRNEEIGELRCLLEQQNELAEAGFTTADNGVAVGAAAIAQMLDSDELVREERERLQQMQTEWEDKFRRVEIEASLERAKLSRERQELAKKNGELEEQLEHLQRETRVADPATGKTRRWLAELGLTSE